MTGMGNPMNATNMTGMGNPMNAPNMPNMGGPMNGTNIPSMGGPMNMPSMGGPMNMPSMGGSMNMPGMGGPMNMPGMGGPIDMSGMGAPVPPAELSIQTMTLPPEVTTKINEFLKRYPESIPRMQILTLLGRILYGDHSERLKSVHTPVVNVLTPDTNEALILLSQCLDAFGLEHPEGRPERITMPKVRVCRSGLNSGLNMRSLICDPNVSAIIIEIDQIDTTLHDILALLAQNMHVYQHGQMPDYPQKIVFMVNASYVHNLGKLSFRNGLFNFSHASLILREINPMSIVQTSMDNVTLHGVDNSTLSLSTKMRQHVKMDNINPQMNPMPMNPMPMNQPLF